MLDTELKEYKFKVSELIEAVRKNGYPQITGELVAYGEQRTVLAGACAMGQAAINLRVRPADLEKAFTGIMIDVPEEGDVQTYSTSITGYIEGLNDDLDLSCVKIAEKADKELASVKDQEVTFMSREFNLEAELEANRKYANEDI